MDLVDTHCHIHFEKYPIDADKAIANARAAGVNRLICVGTTLADSKRAIGFAAARENIWTTAGVHPHAAAQFTQDKPTQDEFKKILNKSSISAIGEIGLDYYKNYSSKEDQRKALRLQIEAGMELDLPFIFHVRDAWDDFWAIFDSYPDLKGVVHSFSAHSEQLEQALKRNLYVGLNGIMTFTQDARQLEAAKAVPLERLVLETDAPFLAPRPDRGKACEPKHIAVVAEFLAELRGEPLEKLAKATTENAIEIFKFT